MKTKTSGKKKRFVKSFEVKAQGLDAKIFFDDGSQLPFSEYAGRTEKNQKYALKRAGSYAALFFLCVMGVTKLANLSMGPQDIPTLLLMAGTPAIFLLNFFLSFRGVRLLNFNGDAWLLTKEDAQRNEREFKRLDREISQWLDKMAEVDTKEADEADAKAHVLWPRFFKYLYLILFAALTWDYNIPLVPLEFYELRYSLSDEGTVLYYLLWGLAFQACSWIALELTYKLTVKSQKSWQNEIFTPNVFIRRTKLNFIISSLLPVTFLILGHLILAGFYAFTETPSPTWLTLLFYFIFFVLPIIAGVFLIGIRIKSQNSERQVNREVKIRT